MSSSSSPTRAGFVPLFDAAPETDTSAPTFIDLTVLPTVLPTASPVVGGDDDATALPSAAPTAPRAARGPELRTGDWTRFGDASVLGDLVTEGLLSTLAETTRAAARAQGYAVGWAEGRQEAAAAARDEEREHEARRSAEEQRRSAEHAAALAALTRAALDLARAGDVVEELVLGQAVDLARELTEELLGHQLRTSPDPVGDVLRRALRARPADAPVLLRMHPHHVERIEHDGVDDVAGRSLAAAGVRLLPDAHLDLADAVLEVDDSIIDLRLGAALARVREVLT